MMGANVWYSMETALERTIHTGGPMSSRPGPAGQELFMIRTTLDDISQVPFPEGFRMRAMRLDEAGLWTDIQRDAEPYFQVQPHWFEQQFGGDLDAVPCRCFLIVNARGVAVGTVSAWYKDDYHGDRWGQVHWLAVRPAYQRLGLARAAMSFCLTQLARWHDRAFLGTQTARIGAIRLYLEMGFRPDLEHPGAREAWLAIRDQVGYPALQEL
jgi:GNAT superfamily N-acetyltransferase